jgi:hypothetical protein
MIVMNIEEIRTKVKEITTKDLIRSAMRARKFSGAETLIEGMELIDFALEIRNRNYEKNQRYT